MSASTLHDLIGVGFGPSNLALVIALQELSQSNGKPIDALFMDKQEHYRWHGDTLSSQSELQISFLKDLVSLRNPTSPYSFVNDLNDSFPSVRAEMILRSSALKPADDLPFVNEIFAPAYTDLVFQQAPEDRKKLIGEYHNTNYSVVDLELIERIHAVLYRQKITRQPRHAVLCRQHVEAAVGVEGGIELTLRDLATGQQQTHRYDAVIVATGYERKRHQHLLEPLLPYLHGLEVDRTYRALATPQLKAPVFLQGFCEATHGLSDTLLSVLPMRSAEIGEALYGALNLSSSAHQAQTKPLASVC